MHSYWNKFRKNRLYLLNYFIISALIVASLVLLQVFFLVDWHSYTNFQLSYKGLLLLPLGLIIGVQIPAIMHNCVHGNFKQKWMNRVVGELAGIYILLGMAAFEINHRMHHVHSDTDLDPHNPEGKPFFSFFFANNFGGTEPVLRKFLQFHGDTGKNRLIFKAIVFFHFINVPLRILFWLFLLGPSLFLTFFLPSYLFHMFVFAHINYYTHETFDGGPAEVYNLNSNLYYRFVNFFGSGVYFHKNHHINPNHYNPQKGASSSWLFR